MKVFSNNIPAQQFSFQRYTLSKSSNLKTQSVARFICCICPSTDSYRGEMKLKKKTQKLLNFIKII